MKLTTISWLIASILPTATLAQTFQYGSRFPKNKLYNLEPGAIGLDNIDGTVAAFGDFNGDKLWVGQSLSTHTDINHIIQYRLICLEFRSDIRFDISVESWYVFLLNKHNE